MTKKKTFKVNYNIKNFFFMIPMHYRKTRFIKIKERQSEAYEEQKSKTSCCFSLKHFKIIIN